MKALIESFKRLLHLHDCEQEGLTSGQPTPEQWFEAVENAKKAMEEYANSQRGNVRTEDCIIATTFFHSDVCNKCGRKVDEHPVKGGVSIIPTQSGTKGAEGARSCETCRYLNDGNTYHDRMWCRDCKQKDRWEKPPEPLTGGMSEEMIEAIIKEVEDRHPYKKSGYMDSYSQYNEGWSDACDILGQKIKSALKSLHLPSEGEIATMAKEVIPEDLYNDASGYPSIEDRNYEKRKLWIAGAGAILNLIKGG